MLVFTDFSQGLKLAKRTLILILGFKFLSNCTPRHHRVKWDREQQSCFLPKFIWPLMGPGSLVLSRSLGLTQEQHQTHCFEKQRQMFFKAPDWEKNHQIFEKFVTGAKHSSRQRGRLSMRGVQPDANPAMQRKQSKEAKKPILSWWLSQHRFHQEPSIYFQQLSGALIQHLRWPLN